MDRPPPYPGPARRRRLFLWISAPFLLVALLLAEENARGRWLRSRVEGAMRAEGARATLAALGLPAPEPADNGAPAVLAAAVELKALAESHRLVSSGPRGLMKPAEPGHASCAHREARFPSGNGYRSPHQEGANAADDWLLAIAQLTAARAPLDRLRAALAQPTLALKSDYSARFPTFGDLNQAHAWLRSHAICALHGGNLEAAIDDILACCALARLQRTDLHLISQVSAEITDAFATELIWEALQAGGWTEERLARLAAGARDDGGQISAAMRSFEVERALVPVFFESARQNRTARAIAFRLHGVDLFGDPSTPPPSEWGVQLHSFLWWAAWSHNDEAHALSLWRTFLARARDFGVDHSWLKFEAQYPRRRAEAGGLTRWRQSFSDMLNPSPAWYVLSNLTRNATERQMALTAIALRRWELREHRLPPALAPLVPALLPAAPIDYMDGRPLRYARGPDGAYALYSVGLDGKDDGGDPATTTGSDRVRSLWGGRDAVWPALAIPKAAAR